MKRKYLLIAMSAALFGFIGFYAGLKDRAPELPPPQASTAFFAQELPDLQGNPQSLSKWQGKILVVNFWATWCAPCVEEMPELEELHQQKHGQNIQILGIGIDSQAKMAEFAQQYNITYPLYVAGMEGIELARQFGNQAGGLPYTVLIDSRGIARKTYLGRLKMDQLRRDIALM